MGGLQRTVALLPAHSKKANFAPDIRRGIASVPRLRAHVIQVAGRSSNGIVACGAQRNST